MVGIGKFAVAVAVVAVVFVSAIGRTQADSEPSEREIDRQLEQLNSFTVSKWKFEVRDWPQTAQCGGFWLRLEATLKGKLATRDLEPDDRQSAGALVGQAEAAILRRLADRLRARSVSSGLLVAFLDECAAQAAPPEVKAVKVSPAAAEGQRLVGLQAELAQVREQLRAAQAAKEQTETVGRQMGGELAAVRENLERQRSSLAGEFTREIENLRADMGERLRVALAANGRLQDENQRLRQSQGQLTDRLRAAEVALRDKEVSCSSMELQLRRQVELANGQLESAKSESVGSNIGQFGIPVELEKDIENLIRKNDHLVGAVKQFEKRITKKDAEKKKLAERVAKLDKKCSKLEKSNKELEKKLQKYSKD